MRPSGAGEPVKALVYREQIAADLLNAPRNSVAVQRPQHIQRFQDHKCQRALLNVGFLFHSVTFPLCYLGFQQEYCHTPFGKTTCISLGWPWGGRSSGNTIAAAPHIAIRTPGALALFEKANP